MCTKPKLKILLTIIIIAILTYLPFYVTKDLKNNMDQKAIEKIVENYIKNNAKVIDDAMRAYFKLPPTAEKAPAVDRTKKIQENKAEINKLEGAVILANPNGKINMVEFIDFKCPFCKKNLKTMEKITKDNPNVRWILKPMTPMGGVDQAKAVYAANLQGSDKALLLHEALFNGDKNINKDGILKIAEENGLDIIRFERDFDSEAVSKQIENSEKLFYQKLGGGGVPSTIIGDTFIEGAYPEVEFLNAIEKIK